MVEQDGSPAGKKARGPLGFKRFFDARRVLAGAELFQKIVKFPKRFGTAPVEMWHHVLGT